MIQINHNPRCGKSRNCIAFIEETGQEFEVIKYLEETPSFQELASVIKKLDCKPINLQSQRKNLD